jgi:small neutral amino acid transporter SnatA (MarC family)
MLLCHYCLKSFIALWPTRYKKSILRFLLHLFHASHPMSAIEILLSVLLRISSKHHIVDGHEESVVVLEVFVVNVMKGRAIE